MSALSNAKWIAVSQSCRLILQLVGLTILARLVSPTEYGLMAMATVVTNFALLLRDLGTSAAIIHKHEIEDDTICTVFWINISMGCIVGVLLMLSTPYFSRIFNSSELSTILWILALSFPIASLSSVHQALLERKSAFRVLARIEIVSAICGLLVAIIAAWLGAGVYSLVGQTLVTIILSSSQLWIASDWIPRFYANKSELKYLADFSGNLTLFNVINYFSRNADGIIIGHYFSAAILGAYSLAYRIMLFPIMSLSGVASRALYPVISRQQSDLLAMKKLYLRVIAIISFIVAPLMAGLVILREPFIHIVFGEKWSLVPSLLLWLAPTGFIQSLVSTTGAIFMARGSTYILMRLGIMSAILQVGAFIVGANYNVEYMAAFYFLANIINAIPCLYFTMRQLNGTLSELGRELIAPAICSGIMICGLSLIRFFYIKNGENIDLLTFILYVFCGVVGYTFSAFFLFKNRLNDVRNIMVSRHILNRAI